jgi:uncharacterized protein (DUF433 family)
LFLKEAKADPKPKSSHESSKAIPMKRRQQNIYGGKDPREVAAYSIAEAARYLKIAPSTLRSWVAGREYPKRKGAGLFLPLIAIPQGHPPWLSFHNLVEAYVLRALRTEHGVSIDAVRKAIDFAAKSYKVGRLLLSPELRTDAGELLLDKYGELVNLTRSGQLAMKKILEAHLKRVEWDQADMPTRFYPFVISNGLADRKVIVIDPHRSFGRPIVARRGISTAVIVDRIDAGESIEDIATDYDLEREEIEEAIVYARAA